jgi:hypothetical protein
MFRVLGMYNFDLRNDPRVTTHPVYYIMPILNPDGYEFSRTPGHRLWRKNRSSPPPGSDCYGIDLNRNYDVVGFFFFFCNRRNSFLSFGGPQLYNSEALPFTYVVKELADKLYNPVTYR